MLSAAYFTDVVGLAQISALDVSASAADGAAHGRVARRGAHAQSNPAAGDDARVELGLSIGHISPHSSKSLRVARGEAIGEGWGDRPNVGMGRNGQGSLVAAEGKPPKVTWCPQGSFLKVSKPSLYRVKSSLESPPAARGSVSGFSRRSRCRLTQTLTKVKRSQLPLFVTLTYPNEWPEDPKQWKRHLDSFGKRLIRRWSSAGFVWKLEPQQRGAPHFHLLLWIDGLQQVEAYAQMRAFVPLAWYQVVCSGDDKHLRAGTRVEMVRSWRGVMFYAAKYFGKPVEVDSDSWGRPGRFWGMVGRASIPWADELETWIGYNQACDLMRWIRRFRHLKGRDACSMWVCVDAPDVWVSNIERLG